jgi:hypothetical protein
MNTKRMILLVPLMILASCGGKPADPGGASTPQGVPDASAQPAAAQSERRGPPVRNGPYVVCNIKDYEPGESPTLKKGFTLAVGDKIDIDGEKVTGDVSLVAAVKFHRDPDPELSVTLNMVGCCERRTLATTHRLAEGEPLRLITIVDETATYTPEEFCADTYKRTGGKPRTEGPRLITVRFCYQRMDDQKGRAWACAGGKNPHGGDVHAVNP